jgi:AraC-like DNA-binding protein
MEPIISFSNNIKAPFMRSLEHANLPVPLNKCIASCTYGVFQTGFSRNFIALPENDCFCIIFEVNPGFKNRIKIKGLYPSSTTVKHGAQGSINFSFYPASLPLFFKNKIAHLREKEAVFSLDMLNICPPVNIKRILYESDNIELILSTFMKVLIGSYLPNLNKASSIANFIYHSHGKAALKKITQKMFISERHCIRIFKQNYGIGVHKYANMVKIAKLIKVVCSGSRPHYASLALDLGYYDQTHMIKSFKRSVGKTPEMLRKTVNGSV